MTGESSPASTPAEEHLEVYPYQSDLQSYAQPPIHDLYHEIFRELCTANQAKKSDVLFTTVNDSETPRNKVITLALDFSCTPDKEIATNGEEFEETSGGEDEDSSDDGQSNCQTFGVKAKREGDYQHRKAIRHLEGHVTSLMDLLPTIQHFCDDEHVFESQEKARSRIQPTKSPSAADAFISQVVDKFSLVNASLARRLGEAGWERFRRLQRNLARHEKLRNLGEASSEDEDGEAFTDEDEPSNFVPASKFHDSGLGTSLATQSRYAASAASHTSFLSTKSTTEGVHRVPPTPNEVFSGVPFHCKLCNRKIDYIDSRVKWKSWEEHEFTTHRYREIYRCGRCEPTFDTIDSFKEHVRAKHYDLNKDVREWIVMHPLLTLVERDIKQEQCTLCHQSGFKDRRSFVTHISRHLEQIALVSLPASMTEGNDSAEESSSDLEDVIDPLNAPNKAEALLSALNQPHIDALQNIVKESNLTLPPFLIDRIAHEQKGRYRRLIHLRRQHKGNWSNNREAFELKDPQDPLSLPGGCQLPGEFRCPYCSQKRKFTKHLVREHKLPEPRMPRKGKGVTDHNPVWNLLEKCRFENSLSPTEEPCKFCGQILNTWKKLATHVAKHMEQIAFPVLSLVGNTTLWVETPPTPLHALPQSRQVQPDKLPLSEDQNLPESLAKSLEEEEGGAPMNSQFSTAREPVGKSDILTTHLPSDPTPVKGQPLPKISEFFTASSKIGQAGQVEPLFDDSSKMNALPTQAPSGCQRCTAQKQYCDGHKPCTHCREAGIHADGCIHWDEHKYGVDGFQTPPPEAGDSRPRTSRPFERTLDSDLVDGYVMSNVYQSASSEVNVVDENTLRPLKGTEREIDDPFWASDGPMSGHYRGVPWTSGAVGNESFDSSAKKEGNFPYTPELDIKVDVGPEPCEDEPAFRPVMFQHTFAESFAKSTTESLERRKD
ncbi:uncharacterized protein KY384_001639 [Bacidia gigantensis]|uniref:uncharacterized protein n=1 Tax=Bacidia gigantensis TaxID=2732470 RepID=UPI001D057122|nr:uncharacterized protein KY384_001639 [Bacidia gigantensis]KAG8533898.1 hypothetical protein KY384_001639 [Bacidia gigantensis]